MLSRHLLTLPVHASRLSVIYLHAIHADIAFPCPGIARNHAWQRDEPPSIFWPALQDLKIVQRYPAAAMNHLFAWAAIHVLRKEFAQVGQHGQHLDLVEQPLRRLHVHEYAEAICDLVERV